MTEKIADDFVAIAARLKELTQRQEAMAERRASLYGICPRCNGKGAMVVPHPDPRQLPTLDPCPLCGGSGTVRT